MNGTAPSGIVVPATEGPVVYVADLDEPVLRPADDHHLRRVRRLRVGSQIALADGRGSWRPARLADGGVLPVGPAVTVEPPARSITVGFALVKGDRPELVCQKLTELAVDRIVPFVAARSVVRWSAERAGRHAERLRSVAREAGMQSRRVRLPEVDDSRTFVEVLSALSALAGGDGVALADIGGDVLDGSVSVLLVGPEGGWAPEERAAVARRVRLGDGVLRAETAAIAAGALLAACRSGVVVPPGDRP